jgi:hypothetical protein
LPFNVASLFAVGVGVFGSCAVDAPHGPEQLAGDATRAQPDANLAAKSNAKQTISRTLTLHIFLHLSFSVSPQGRRSGGYGAASVLATRVGNLSFDIQSFDSMWKKTANHREGKRLPYPSKL